MPTETGPETPSGTTSVPGVSAIAVEADTETLKHRARRGVVALVARGTIVQVAHLGGTVALARLLHPEDFGIFTIVQFVVAFFAYFGDAGLGAALIQQHGVPTQRRLSSVFSLQVVLSGLVVIGVSLAAGPITGLWHDLPAATSWVLRALSVSLLLTCIRVVPSILMEREMLFGRLSVIEVVQILSYYVAGVGLAWAGYGVWALVASVVTQSVVGAVGCYIARPWRPDPVLDLDEIRGIIRFGVAYQVKGVVGFVNTAVVPIYAGITLGARAVGFIEWGQSTAFFPLKLVDVMARVSFPLLSRLRHDRALFAQTLERSVQLCAMGTLLMVGLFLGIGPGVTRVIYSAQWLPGLPLLYIYALAISIGFLSPLIAPALDALGKPHVFAWIAIGWTVINWIAIPIATHWGVVGFAAGYSVHIVVGNLAIVVVLWRLVPEARLWHRISAPIAGSVAVAAFGRAFLDPTTPLGLVGAILVLIAVFGGVVTLVDRRAIRDAMAVIPR